MDTQTVKNLLLDSNNILVSTSSFFALKKALLENIGHDKTKSFLFKFGYEIGISAESAKESKVDNESHRGKKSMHALYGHVRDVIIDPNFDKLLDGRTEKITGQWIDSFEAEVHKKDSEYYNDCDCFTLCGYVSGFLSKRYKHSLIAVEKKCVGKGDSCCEFEVRLEENWTEETISFYKSATILDELETTYDSLLQHRQLLDLISTFHNSLTQALIEKRTLQEIVQSAYDVLKIPIVIENLHGDEILNVGLTEEQLQTMKNEQSKLTYNQNYSNNSLYESGSFSKLISPVLINKKHYANCSFIYFPPQSMDTSDHLYLDRLSTVVSLSFLYENAQIEEQERLTHTLLEQLINKKFKSSKEIESYLKFFPFKIQGPFSTMIVRISQKVQDELFIDLHEQLLLLSKHFNSHKIPSILSIIGENIVILNSRYTDKKQFEKSIKSIFQVIEKRHPNYQYSLGVSTTFESLLTFDITFDEALISEKISKPVQIKYYEDLGFLGNFIANMSTKQLHATAKEMLHELYDFNDIRKKDLLHTLYSYLSNGQKLKETMESLSISMGGLQYRIKQIELLLQRSLKDSSFSAYLLLILDSLILLDELQFT